MTRSEFEAKLKTLPSAAKNAIESAPVAYFIVGIVFGVLLSRFYRPILWLVFLTIAFLVIRWFMSEKEQSNFGSFPTNPTDPGPGTPKSNEGSFDGNSNRGNNQASSDW